MWILPKQLHTCHSVQVMTESESDLNEFYQTCEQSLMWRSKPSQSPTWSRRWKANSWMQHLSTRMLRPSHTKSFVEEWTSYQEVSLANPLVMLELKKELKTLDTFIPTSAEESKSADLQLCFWKTSKELSQAKQQTENQFSTMCLKTWKDWVTKQRQEYSRRVKSASLIREKESSFLAFPTPMARDYKDTPGMTPKHKYPTLPRVVHSFPTPTTRDWKDGTAENCKNVPSNNLLGREIHNWGTPKEQDSRAAMTDRGKHNMGEQVHGMYNQSQDQTNPNTNGKNLVLNPSWVEQLMGLTVGWTDCVFSEME